MHHEGGDHFDSDVYGGDGEDNDEELDDEWRHARQTTQKASSTLGDHPSSDGMLLPSSDRGLSPQGSRRSSWISHSNGHGGSSVGHGSSGGEGRSSSRVAAMKRLSRAGEPGGGAGGNLVRRISVRDSWYSNSTVLGKGPNGVGAGTGGGGYGLGFGFQR